MHTANQARKRCRTLASFFKSAVSAASTIPCSSLVLKQVGILFAKCMQYSLQCSHRFKICQQPFTKVASVTIYLYSMPGCDDMAHAHKKRLVCAGGYTHAVVLALLATPSPIMSLQRLGVDLSPAYTRYFILESFPPVCCFVVLAQLSTPHQGRYGSYTSIVTPS
jgi:hypothetical protein